MAPSPLVYLQPFERRNRLAMLGLTEDELHEAVQRGHLFFVTCTANHPPTAAGFYGWSEGTAKLREVKAPHGWTAQNESNLPFTVNPTNTLAVMIASGNEFTGREGDEQPSTRSRKGPRTKKAIRVNLANTLFGDIRKLPDVIAQGQQQGRQTWILLVYRDKKNNEVRCELSRPTKMDNKGHVTGWDERIILQPLPFTNDAVKVSNEELPQTAEIDVKIKKKA